MMMGTVRSHCKELLMRFLVDDENEACVPYKKS